MILPNSYKMDLQLLEQLLSQVHQAQSVGDLIPILDALIKNNFSECAHRQVEA